MSNQLKMRLLIGGIVLLGFASYHLAVKKTLTLISQHKVLKEQMIGVGNTDSRLSLLKQKEIVYDSLLQGLSLANTSIQNNLLRRLNSECQERKLILSDFNEPHIFYEENQDRHTFTFGLRGPFTGILETIYSLEQQGNFGRVVHVAFEKKQDYRRRKAYLEAQVFVQQLQ